MAKAYIPELDTIINCIEGTGDNLLDEDIDEGYVDYVMITTQEHNGDYFEEDTDGGMMLLTEAFIDAYPDEDKLIQDCIKFQFGAPFKYIKLEVHFD